MYKRQPLNCWLYPFRTLFYPPPSQQFQQRISLIPNLCSVLVSLVNKLYNPHKPLHQCFPQIQVLSALHDYLFYLIFPYTSFSLEIILLIYCLLVYSSVNILAKHQLPIALLFFLLCDFYYRRLFSKLYSIICSHTAPIICSLSKNNICLLYTSRCV